MIFPIYLIDTQKLCRSFDQVKLNLWNRHIKYSSPEDASQWLDSLPRG